MIQPESSSSTNGEVHLDELFSRYRSATEFADAGPDFMPALWQRIESRRRNSLMVERFARVFTSATVAAAVAAGLFVSFAPNRPQTESWVETLANHHLAQNAAYYEPVHLSQNPAQK
jgi:hypothetical protein